MKFLEDPKNQTQVEDLVTAGLTMYNSTGRFYHGPSHIAAMTLFGATKLKDEDLSNSLMLAVVWHDAVICANPSLKAGSEEAISSMLFCHLAASRFVPKEEYIEIADAINKTALHFSNHQVMNDMTRMEKTLLSLDLISLGHDPDAFIQHTINVYKEYYHYLKKVNNTLDSFLEKRKSLFQVLLDRPMIYYNEEVKAEYETRAQFNLSCFVEGKLDDLIIDGVTKSGYLL